jgi:hypothetical protein
MLSTSNLGSGANSPYERSLLGSAANSNVELATMPYAVRGDGGGTHVKYDSVGAGGVQDTSIQVSERWNASAGVSVGVDGDRWSGDGDVTGAWKRKGWRDSEVAMKWGRERGTLAGAGRASQKSLALATLVFFALT